MQCISFHYQHCPAQIQKRQFLNLSTFSGEMWDLDTHSDTKGERFWRWLLLKKKKKKSCVKSWLSFFCQSDGADTWGSLVSSPHPAGALSAFISPWWEHTHIFLKIKSHHHTQCLPNTQLLGWWAQQLFILWALNDVQSSTECVMQCSANHKSD